LRSVCVLKGDSCEITQEKHLLSV